MKWVTWCLVATVACHEPVRDDTSEPEPIRPDVCGMLTAASPAISAALAALEDGSGSTSLPYDEQCRLIEDLFARVGAAVDPLQSEGARNLVLYTYGDGATGDEPPVGGTYVSTDDSSGDPRDQSGRPRARVARWSSVSVGISTNTG